MSRILALCLGVGAALLGSAAFADLDPPLPVMKDVTAQSDVRFDPKSGLYTYLYTASNGTASTGSVGSLFLEGTTAKDVQVPVGWRWEVRQDGSLMVVYAGMGPGTPPGSLLTPGGQMRFSLTSTAPPVIKVLRLRADWIPEGDAPVDDATAEQYTRLETPVHALAPGNEKPGSFEHWSRFRDDLSLATMLGWLPDGQFAQTAKAELAASRQAFDTQGPHGAEAPLKALLAGVAASTPAQRTPAAYALLELNAQALLVQMEAAPVTAAAPPRGDAFELKLDDAGDRTAALGYPARFSGLLTDRADDDKPVADYPISLFVGAGPDENLRVTTKTGADGRFTLEFNGTVHGSDDVVVGNRPYSKVVQVTWEGGPDLVMSGLVAPMIEWRGFGLIHMYDTVTNAGDGPAGPSTVRYYASPTQPVYPGMARVVGTRQVPALKPDESDEAPKAPITFPADLPPGMYFLTACVTIDSGIPDANPGNNCENENGPGRHMIMMAVPATTHAPP